VTTPPTLSPPKTKTWLERLPSATVLGPVLALVLASLYFTTQTDRFLTGQNFALILQQVMVVAVIAIGQTLVILTAGIDLSCGMVMAVGNVVMAKFAVEMGVPPGLAILAGILVTTAFGFVNGLLITRLRLPPFIVTLGMYNIAFAISQIYSNAQTVTILDAGSPLVVFGQTINLGGTALSWGVILTIFLYILAWFILSETSPGRHLYAVGNNPEAARLTGIPTMRVLLIVYTLAGTLYGIAAWLLVSRTGVGDPNAGQTENLEAITAVVLGGTSLFGGRGMIFGTLLGALIVGVFRNGLTLTGVSSVFQILITGILVILAVATDQLSKPKGR
jgi:fructose transport system permease protein